MALIPYANSPQTWKLTADDSEQKDFYTIQKGKGSGEDATGDLELTPSTSADAILNRARAQLQTQVKGEEGGALLQSIANNKSGGKRTSVACTCKKKPRSKSKPKTSAKPKSKTKSKPKPKSKTKSKTKGKRSPKAGSKSKSKAKPKSKSKPKRKATGKISSKKGQRQTKK